MIKFYVFPLARVQKVLFTEPHVNICITTPGDPHAILSDNEDNMGILQLAYDDVDTCIGPETKPFQPEHALEIFNFLKLKEDGSCRDDIETIVCNCQMGRCRSAATAAALSVIINGPRTDQEFFNNPRYNPNMRVYRTILDTFYQR